MTLPAPYTTAAQARGVELWFWLEIEGLPYAYGNFAGAGSMFSTRAAAEQFLGVKGWIAKPLTTFEQSVDALNGTSNIGFISAEILDRDSTLTLDLGLSVGKGTHKLTLASAITAADTSLTANETPDATAYPTGGGTIYLNRETLTYTSRVGSTFSGLARARYRSTAAVHAEGSIATHFPRFLGQRQARVLYFLGTAAQRADSATVEAGAVIRLLGIVVSCTQNKECTGFVVKVDSIDRRMSGFIGVDRKKLVFSEQMRMTLTRGIPGRGEDGQPHFDGGDDNQPMRDDVTGLLTDASVWVSTPMFSSGGLLAYNLARGRGRTFFVRVDDEILMVEGVDRRKFLNIKARGLWGTVRDQHDQGAELVEVMPLVGTGPDDGTISAPDPRYYLPNLAANPVDFALAILTSTGAGTNGAYDKLPKDWGLGVPASWLDTSEIETIRDLRVAAPGVAAIIEEPFDARDFLTREVFQTFGLFPVTKLNGQTSWRRLDPPLPLDVVTALGPDDVIEAPAWDANLGATVGRVTYKYDRTIGGEHLTVTQTDFSDADVLYDGVFGEVTRESAFLREAPETVGGRGEGRLVFIGQGAAGGAHEWATSQIGWWQTFFERPPPVVDIQTIWKHHVLEAGDFVSLDSTVTPDVQAGALGLVVAPFVVTKKRIDDKAAKVSLTLMQTGIRADQMRHIAPAGIVTAWSSGAKVLTIDADDDDDCAIPGERDVSYFAAGYKVVVMRADASASSEVLTVGSVTSLTVTLSAAPAVFVPASGDVLRFAPYDDCVAEQRARYAFRADSARHLGAANDAAHEMVP